MGSIPVAGAKKGLTTFVVGSFLTRNVIEPISKMLAFWIGCAFSAKTDGSSLTSGQTKIVHEVNLPDKLRGAALFSRAVEVIPLLGEMSPRDKRVAPCQESFPYKRTSDGCPYNFAVCFAVYINAKIPDYVEDFFLSFLLNLTKLNEISVCAGM